jgi:methyl-accepting chemotaxis protein
MDFDEVLQSHRSWRLSFRTALAKQEAMSSSLAGRSDACAFGRWLLGSAKEQYGHLPSFRTLVSQHTLFHQEAGMIADLINSGKLEAAAREFEPASPFSAASLEIGSTMSMLKRDAAMVH